MKYKWLNETIPQDKRKETNDKVLYLINNNLLEKYKVSPEIIYNSYTGKGGTHDLDFSKFDSYYSFSQEKKLLEEGQFYTSHSICKFVMDCLKPNDTDIIADLTSGIGNFCNFAPIEDNVYLNEIDLNSVKVARVLYPHAKITSDDIRMYEPRTYFDIIVGNPPYGLKFVIDIAECMSQYYYLYKAKELLKPLGLLAIVVPNSFLNDEFTDKAHIKYVNDNFNFICQFDIPKDSFKQVGINNIETKVVMLQKKSEVLQKEIPYSFNKINVKITEDYSNEIHNRYIKPLYKEKQEVKTKVMLEVLKEVSVNNQDMQDFQFKVNKMLFDIKRNPKTKKYYSKVYEIYNRFLTEKCPDGMKFEEWQKKRLTQKKVIANLRHYLNKQHEIPKDEIRLVKTNYGVKLKAYSRKMQLLLNKMDNVKEISFNDMVINNNYPFDDKSCKKLYTEKKKAYELQTRNFKEMEEDKDIKTFLDNWSVFSKSNNEKIQLNEVQKQELNKMLQKKYGLLQFECGTGKSLLGLSAIQYRFENNNIHNAFIIAPAISINNTFDEILKDYGLDYIRINSFKDINSIQKGQIVIITFNQLCKCKRFLKKYIKRINNNTMLLLDEADNICNIDSKRSKTVFDVFRHSRYKLLTTATSTRNNINEFFPEMWLLYNSSINMVSKCEYIYNLDKKEGTLNEERNPNYLKPIPPYKEGLRVFSSQHQPNKVTVFGMAKNDQSIYNSDKLKELIDYTVITKTFEDVVGKKIYTIEQETCNFNADEKILYSKIVNEFHALRFNYFNSSGNYRKDSMFAILQQINLMIKSCSVSHLFKEYTGEGVSSKFKKVDSLVGKYSNERVCIGCKYIKTVNSYYNYLTDLFPNRPIFIITGESTTLNKRKKIIKELEATEDGILICTQSSLSSSMNIDFVDKVILPELDYNDAKMRQFYFRFIRLTSKRLKNVIFVTHENSIESNILSLVLCKEKINYFMKDKVINDEEIWEEYGVDFDILNMLMTKEEDLEGKIRIAWGEQEIK